MTESEMTNTPEPPNPSGEAQRRPVLTQVGEAIAYMRDSANTESKRAGDTSNAILLPISCVLLVAAILLQCSPHLKMIAFAVPLFTFSYYIANRIGIVKTFTQRQAYLTWHILIATLLLGGTATLFFVYTGAFIVMTATRGQ